MAGENFRGYWMRKLFILFYNLIEYLFFPMALLYATLLACYFLIGVEFATVLLWIGVILLADLLLIIIMHLCFSDIDVDFEDDQY